MDSVGGMVISPFVGWILETTKTPANPNGSYFIIFTIAASAYLLALAIIHLLTPRLEPANINYE